jgi:hypothetical protein
MDKVIADIRSFIDSQVREGFKSVHEIVENTTHYALETFGYDDLHTEVQSIVAELLVTHQTEQGT